MLPGIGRLIGLFGGILSGGGFSAAAAPGILSKTLGSFGPADLNMTSDPTTVTPTGGQAPYTYAWTLDSGDAAIAPNAAAAATTDFDAAVPLGATLSALYVCTVTDANGATAQALCSITLHHVDFS